VQRRVRFVTGIGPLVTLKQKLDLCVYFSGSIKEWIFFGFVAKL
jgi:hypothetical protein